MYVPILLDSESIKTYFKQRSHKKKSTKGVTNGKRNVGINTRPTQ